MCQFLSLTVTKSGKVYGDGSYDDHERQIKENVKNDPELKDDKEPPNDTFARIEISPRDKNIFNHKLSNWQLKLDEKIEPKWWKAKKKILEKKCFTRLKQVFKRQFLVGGEYDELPFDNVRFVKDVKIGLLKNNQKIDKMRDLSQVGKMRDSSQVGEMWDSSQVGEMLGSSQVGEMWNSSQVGKMRDSSQVGEMWNSSQVGEMRDLSQVGEMLGSSQVGEMWGSTTIINKLSKDAKIKKQEGGKTVIIDRSSDKVEVSVK